MCVFSVKIWLIKTLTRTVKHESQVIKSNPVGGVLNLRKIWGAKFQLGDFGDPDTASKNVREY